MIRNFSLYVKYIEYRQSVRCHLTLFENQTIFYPDIILWSIFVFGWVTYSLGDQLGLCNWFSSSFIDQLGPTMTKSPNLFVSQSTNETSLKLNQ